MTDTAQPMAAETDPVANAVDAFKTALGQNDKPRDDVGRFKSTKEPEAPVEAEETEEIETEEEAHAEPEVEDSDEETYDEGEDAEEAQPEPVAMPTSWAKEDAELWTVLPPEAQAKIAEREGQRDAAVNQKFQEAANVRRENESLIAEAANNRDRFAQLADMAMSMIQPEEPSLSMLDINSDDYDPDGYHLKRAVYERQLASINQLYASSQEAAQAKAREGEVAAQARFEQINENTRDPLLQDVPELGKRETAQAKFDELIDYAVKTGAPRELFQTPTTALEWHMIWKAQQWDNAQAAKARVASEPPPKAKAQPPVRPGVTTSNSARKQARVDKDIKRLSKSGSIEDGAAVWKHLLKG